MTSLKFWRPDAYQISGFAGLMGSLTNAIATAGFAKTHDISHVLISSAAAIWTTVASIKLLFGRGKYKDSAIKADIGLSLIAAILYGAGGYLMPDNVALLGSAFFLAEAILKAFKETNKFKPMKAASLASFPAGIACAVVGFHILPLVWAVQLTGWMFIGYGAQFLSKGLGANKGKTAPSPIL